MAAISTEALNLSVLQTQAENLWGQGPTNLTPEQAIELSNSTASILLMEIHSSRHHSKPRFGYWPIQGYPNSYVRHIQVIERVRDKGKDIGYHSRVLGKEIQLSYTWKSPDHALWSVNISDRLINATGTTPARQEINVTIQKGDELSRNFNHSSVKQS